jgi:ribose/xylose/arabinose/galactoside ABC-type transport system permease subunit
MDLSFFTLSVCSNSTWDLMGLGGKLFLASHELALLTVCLSLATSSSFFGVSSLKRTVLIAFRERSLSMGLNSNLCSYYCGYLVYGLICTKESSFLIFCLSGVMCGDLLYEESRAEVVL